MERSLQVMKTIYKRFRKSKIFALPVVTVFFISFQLITPASDMVLIRGGDLVTTDPLTLQVLHITIKPFLLDKNLVTVSEFDEFVKSTGYVTHADKFGNAAVLDFKSNEWTLIDGANYHYPLGRSHEKAKGDHPVTQVSWHDAVAFAKWKGKRLPSQWEWEHAAKNAKDTNEQYSWGADLIINGVYKANTWQGSFPYQNTMEDGYAYTSPVGVFGENEIGLTDMGGNVWQWCQDSVAPTLIEASADPSDRKVLRGGSFLCDPMVCHGFKITGRSSSTPESSLMHTGFRCAKDL